LIVAALALIVLVVLVIIFNDKAREWHKETNDCQRRGGLCIPEEECDFFSRSSYGCPAEGYVCCLNPCLTNGGTCMDICKEDYNTKEKECNNKCPRDFNMLYLPGCPEDKVCCKLKAEAR